jgi:spermidine synthase
MGVLLSGFVLLGIIGETRTIGLGILVNLIVAVLAAWRGGGSIEPVAAESTAETAPVRIYPTSCRRAVVLVFALSGFVALASEVIWSRMLLLYQGTSIYAFSSMLAVVLSGMAAGSLFGGQKVTRWTDPLRQLARVQLGIGLAGALALHVFRDVGAGYFWPALVLLGPLGFLWGLAFPLGAACYAGGDAGRSMGTLYSWNTIGCIAGSLGAGFLLIPLWGASTSASGLAAVSLLLGVLLLAVHPQGLGQRVRAVEGCLAVVTILLLAFVGDPYYDVLTERMRDLYPSGATVLAHSEDAAATTTVFERTGGRWSDKQLWINGEGMTCLAPVTKLMAHLPIALADDPKEALVVCFGMGTSVRSACSHRGLHVRAVELLAAVPRAYPLFHPDAADLLQRAHLNIVIDDGRNYLLMHPQQYDVITLDPPPPLHAAGTVNLYSRDFFELCRQRLRPRGVLCAWVQPDKLSENKMIFQAFLDVFAHVRVWTGPEPHRGFLLIGTHEPLNMASVPARIRKLYDESAVAEDLRLWGNHFDQPDKILDLYVMDEARLRHICAGTPMLTDDRPYTEFDLWRPLFPGPDSQISGALPYNHPSRETVVDPYR